MFFNSINGLEDRLREIIELEKRVDEEKASMNILKLVNQELKKALLVIPKGEQEWFSLSTGGRNRESKRSPNPFLPKKGKL